MDKSIVLLSGGLDSSTLLALCVAMGDEVETLSINYGQRHKVELESAKALAAHYGVPHDIVDLTSITKFLGGSALTDDVTVPDGHYAEETMRITVVPNRNAIMLSVATGVAVARGANRVAAAVHAGDHFIYPDCRPEFVESMRNTMLLGTKSFGDIGFFTPFVNQTKANIAHLAAALRLPIELTWSCYKGGTVHCGACGTCFERREAMELAGVQDPTVYASTPHYDDPTLGRISD